MSLVLLLRHARAARAVPGMADFDRPLEQRGLSDARAAGEWMAAAGYRPDLVLCSAAQRTRETWTCIEPALGEPRDGVFFMRQLFNGDADAYLDAIRTADADSVLVIGHNPMIELTARMLIDEAGLGRDDCPAAGFPTSGLAAIRFPGPLSTIKANTGVLEGFLVPRD